MSVGTDTTALIVLLFLALTIATAKENVTETREPAVVILALAETIARFICVKGLGYSILLLLSLPLPLLL